MKEQNLQTISQKHNIEDKRISEIVDYLDRWADDSKTDICTVPKGHIHYHTIARGKEWGLIFGFGTVKIYMSGDKAVDMPLQVLYDNYVGIIGSLRNM